MGFFAGTMNRLKVAKFQMLPCPTFSPCHCKSKTPARMKLSTQMPTLNIFELMQRFRKSVEYLGTCRIFAATVYKVKVAKFQMLSMRKVFALPLQRKIPAHVKLSIQISILHIFELTQRFRKSVKYFWRYRIFLPHCTCWNRQNFKCWHRANFSPCHCKSKIPAHLKLSTQNAHPKHFRAEAKISKIYWILLEIWDFFWQSEEVESGKISNVFDDRIFTLLLQK